MTEAIDMTVGSELELLPAVAPPRPGLAVARVEPAVIAQERLSATRRARRTASPDIRAIAAPLRGQCFSPSPHCPPPPRRGAFLVHVGPVAPPPVWFQARGVTSGPRAASHRRVDDRDRRRGGSRGSHGSSGERRAHQLALTPDDRGGLVSLGNGRIDVIARAAIHETEQAVPAAHAIPFEDPHQRRQLEPRHAHFALGERADVEAVERRRAASRSACSRSRRRRANAVERLNR